MVRLDRSRTDERCRTRLHSGSQNGSLMEDIRAIAVDPTQP